LSIQGATGTQQDYHWSEDRITNLGGGTITHSFLVIPDCPYPYTSYKPLSPSRKKELFWTPNANLL
jgi:hypothetical protein